jgi:hypothetical protein
MLVVAYAVMFSEAVQALAAIKLPCPFASAVPAAFEVGL